MLFWLAIAGGVGMAVLGRKWRLFIMWQCLFNLSIAVYVAVMITPRLAGMLPELSQTAYHHASAMMALGLVIFVALQSFTAGFLSTFGEVKFPAVFDGPGAGVIGFIVGYVAVSFLVFSAYAMPFAQTDWGQKLFGDHAPSAVKAVESVCDTVGKLSIQCHDDQVQRTILWYVRARGGSDVDTSGSINPLPPIKRPDDKDFPPWPK